MCRIRYTGRRCEYGGRKMGFIRNNQSVYYSTCGTIRCRSVNEVLLGLENGLTDEQVKSYFTLSANKMRQYRREYQFGKE